MSDSLFRKAISDKMNAGNLPPDDFIWEGIDADLAEKRAAKRKRRRLILPVILLILGGIGFFFFGKEEVNTIDRKTVPIAIIENSKRNKTTSENLNFQEKESSFDCSKSKHSHKNTSENSRIAHLRKSQISDTFKDIRYLPASKKATNINAMKKVSDINDPRKVSERSSSKVFDTFEGIRYRENENLEVNLPLLAKIESRKLFLKSNLDFEKPTLNFTPKPNEIKPITQKKKFAITTGFESNKLAYCFDEKANHLAAKVEAEYRMTHRFAAGIGFGFHQTNYQFDVDKTTHLEAFGNTDKYPEFYKFNRAVETISNDLKYFTGSLSARYYQPISKNWTSSIGVSQNFILHEKQTITYNFFNNTEDLEITNQSTDFEIGMTGFSLGIHRAIGERLTAGFQFNRYITTRTIGLERQYYHGFGGGINLGFSF